MTVQSMRELFRAAFGAAVRAVDPFERTRQTIPRDLGPVTVLALGKAAPSMARGAADALGDRLLGGVVVSDHREPIPDGMSLMVGDHPFPDRGSVRAGQALLDAATGDLLVLVSGGGSSLVEVPPPGIDISELASTHKALMDAGATISDLNTVRRQISMIKNGGLIRNADSVTTLVISDVIDGPADLVASGPTLADDSTSAMALEVIRKYSVRVPEPIEVWLEGGGGPARRREHHWEIVADGTLALDAAKTFLIDSGLQVQELDVLRGDAEAEATDFLLASPPGLVGVARGETTVRVKGNGLGGRNQHAALAAAIALHGSEGVFAAFGTDGIDGPTVAAGAIIDGGTTARIRLAGLDPVVALANQDSHGVLVASGDAVITGPTGTNVGDIWMAWNRPKGAS